jgi:GNAT superfamily N-acetyltransferase
LNIKLTSNDLTVLEFSNLRSSVGLNPLPTNQIEKALANSLYTVCARDGDTAIAMGRLVGDGAYVYYLQNINVDPRYQSQGIGSLIINNILDYIKQNKLPDTSVMVLLMSSKGSENFYKKFGFRSRPNDNEGPGMIMNL